jgi:hypothetical protein
MDQSRLTASCRHVADPSLTDKDGKQEAEEDDEKHELHGQRLIVAAESKRSCAGV